MILVDRVPNLLALYVQQSGLGLQSRGHFDVGKLSDENQILNRTSVNTLSFGKAFFYATVMKSADICRVYILKWHKLTITILNFSQAFLRLAVSLELKTTLFNQRFPSFLHSITQDSATMADIDK